MCARTRFINTPSASASANRRAPPRIAFVFYLLFIIIMIIYFIFFLNFFTRFVLRSARVSKCGFFRTVPAASHTRRPRAPRLTYVYHHRAGPALLRYVHTRPSRDGIIIIVSPSRGHQPTAAAVGVRVHNATRRLCG